MFNIIGQFCSPVKVLFNVKFSWLAESFGITRETKRHQGDRKQPGEKDRQRRTKREWQEKNQERVEEREERMDQPTCTHTDNLYGFERRKIFQYINRTLVFVFGSELGHKVWILSLVKYLLTYSYIPCSMCKNK